MKVLCYYKTLYRTFWHKGFFKVKK